MQEARDHFMAAENLKGPDGWKENRQFLAKTYIHLKDYTTALEWLDKANEVPVRNPDVSIQTQAFSIDFAPSKLGINQSTGLKVMTKKFTCV